MSITIHLRLFI